MVSDQECLQEVGENFSLEEEPKEEKSFPHKK